MKIVLAPYLTRIKTTRAAVIPYTIVNDSVKFLLGIDRNSSDITDIGGGRKWYECSLSCAARELSEETIGFFSNELNDPIVLNKSAALYDSDKLKLSTIFMPVGIDVYNTIEQEFASKSISCLQSDKKANEMIRLIWVDEKEFIGLINGKSLTGEQSHTTKMWKKLRIFYSKTVNRKFINLLRIIY